MKRLYKTKAKYTKETIIMMPTDVDMCVAHQVFNRRDCLRTGWRFFWQGTKCLFRGIYNAIRWIK